jgi:hypothetical protein
MELPLLKAPLKSASITVLSSKMAGVHREIVDVIA